MRRTMIALLCGMVGAVGLHAYSAKGMVAYKKLCKECHGSGFKGAAMLESDEWERMFAEGAKRLRALHDGDARAMEVLKSRYFRKRLVPLGRFLRNNGRDMGVVRSCDGLNCG